jgi:hypothetical protein
VVVHLWFKLLLKLRQEDCFSQEFEASLGSIEDPV